MARSRVVFAVLWAVLAWTMGVVAPAPATAQVGPLSGHEIVSVDPDAAGKCLDVYDWGRGPWIQMWQCHNGGNQDWAMTIIVSDPTNPIVRFRNYASGKCLDTFPGRGKQLFQWECNVADEYQWIRLHNVGDGHWVFESVSYPGQCLDVIDWGRGTEVMLWDCHFGTNQQWIMYGI